MTGYRWWLCTWNNPPEDYVQQIKDSGAQFGQGQLEIGVSGTKHVQFVVFFPQSLGFKSAQDMLPSCHIIGKPGSAKKDICAYVHKEDTRVAGTQFQFGRAQTITTQSKEKYDAAVQCCKNNQLLDCDSELLVKNLGNLLKLQGLYLEPVETPECKGIWFYGEPGSGKSHLARNLYKDSLFIKGQNKWFDGYRGERNILLDDLDSNAFGHLLKIWADKWKCWGEIKGATVALRHERIIITSNFLPTELWPDNANIRNAVQRRFRFCHVENRKELWGSDFGIIPRHARIGNGNQFINMLE